MCWHSLADQMLVCVTQGPRTRTGSPKQSLCPLRHTTDGLDVSSAIVLVSISLWMHMREIPSGSKSSKTLVHNPIQPASNAKKEHTYTKTIGGARNDETWLVTICQTSTRKNTEPRKTTGILNIQRPLRQISDFNTKIFGSSCSG